MDLRKVQLEANKLQKRLRRHVGQAIGDFCMIDPGDRVMVCLSGQRIHMGFWIFLCDCSDKLPSTLN